MAAGALRCRSAFSARRRPAVASVRFSRMQVSTSRSARPFGAAWRTPLVATARRPRASARSRSAWFAASCSRRRCRCTSITTRPGPKASTRRASRSVSSAGRLPAGRARAPASVSTPGRATSPSTSPSSIPRSEASLPLRDAGLHPRDQPAEVAVAPLRLDEERQRPPAVQAQRGADDRPQARGAGGLEEARGARDAVAVHQGDGGVAEPGGPLHEVLGKRRGPQEGEGRGGVELDGHGEASLFLRLCWRRTDRA